ncbi:MAG: ubiquinol-cytochrome c reductase iron-sulfur subunit [Gammaproteobacteria bacterium]|nr:ubiquinol-cytochrome c reductase iron-sulfur subunit [Gammaproteobacteria bacterium]
MSKEGVDLGKRRFLTAATTVVGGVGVAVALVPFISYMMPSARARAAGAPVEVDISKLELGKKMTIGWRKKPVWVIRRTETNLSDLETLDPEMEDPLSEVPQQPSYTTGRIRAIKPEYMVVIGLCTHLGCSPTFRPDLGAHDLGGDAWKGGFFCPCHGSKFDLSGRVYAGAPAPTNLVVPPHKYLTDTVIIIGEDQGVA